MGKITTKQIVMTVRDLMPAEAVCLGKAHLISDQQVSMLLRLLDVRQVPVDVHQLGQVLGADVVVKAGKDMQGRQSWSGWHKGNWQIAVCEDDPPVMHRFGIAREIKRLLDFPLSKIAYAWSKHIDKHQYQQKVENICDYFAACLLIPRRVLQRAWAAGLRNITCLAQHFLVPVQVMRERVAQLGLADHHAAPAPVLIDDIRTRPQLNHHAVKLRCMRAGGSCDGDLETAKLGRSRQIPTTAVEELIQRVPTQEAY